MLSLLGPKIGGSGRARGKRARVHEAGDGEYSAQWKRDWVRDWRNDGGGRVAAGGHAGRANGMSLGGRREGVKGDGGRRRGGREGSSDGGATGGRDLDDDAAAVAETNGAILFMMRQRDSKRDRETQRHRARLDG